MKTSDFDYYLPKELIAQTPLKNREKARMMLLDKKTGKTSDEIFENIGKVFLGIDVGGHLLL